MARPVLVLLLLAASACGATEITCAARNPDAVTAESKAGIASLQKRLLAGPLFRELQRRSGKARSCTVDIDGAKIGITILFRGGVKLSARADPAAEFTEEKAEVKPMDPARALALLRDAEQYSNRPDGCGMEWTKSEEERSAAKPGNRDVIYRGTACNCQARLTYNRQRVVVLVLRSAC